MKIALVIAQLQSGGAERAVSNLSLAMEKNGHDVSVILLDATRIGFQYGGKIINVNVHQAVSTFGQVITLIKRALKLREIYKKSQFDGIFTFMESTGFPSVLISKEIIVSVHDNPTSLSKIYQPFYPYLYPRAKRVVACAKAIDDELVTRYGLKNTTTIYNSVDIDLITQKSKESIHQTRPYILAMGRLVPQKGFDLLIEAFANSKAKEKLDLIICGSGKEHDQLQALIDKKGLSEKIILKGNVENPFAYYAKADFFVLSSRHEGFPNILIEALACDCPCISFDCKTGPNEIIKEGENGILVEAENIPALTDAIDLLNEDKALQDSFKKNARDSIEHLSTDAISKEWLKLL